MRKVSQSQSGQRDGIAVIELAICLPIILLLIFGTVEACKMLHLKRNLNVAAYEGTRMGILPSADKTLVIDRVEMLLEDRGITGFEIEVEPANFGTVIAGDALTITVTADCSANSSIGLFYGDRSISESMTMIFE